MVATTELRRRLGADLRSIRAEAEFLPELAELWNDESEENRFVWHEEWADLMARLEGLDTAYRSSLMTDEQETSYRELRSRLEALVPILQQLGLRLPSQRTLGE